MTFIKGHINMILFIQTTAVLHKYLKDELKYFVTIFPCGCTEFPEFSMFREIPENSRFSRFSRFVDGNCCSQLSTTITVIHEWLHSYITACRKATHDRAHDSLLAAFSST